MNCLSLLLFAIVICNGEDEEESEEKPCSCSLTEVKLLDLKESFTNCRSFPDNSSSSILVPCVPSSTRLRSIGLSTNKDIQIQVLEHLACNCIYPVQPARRKRSPSPGVNDKRNVLAPVKVSFPPKFGNLTTYETCLACKSQMDFCQEEGKVFDADVCHCVFPASRTFLNSFYTLGVVMLTIMVCCFLVFGVQKGDENVLSSSRRVSSTSNHRRRLSSYRLESGGMPPERSDRIVRPSLTGPSQVNSVNSPVAGAKKDLLNSSEPNSIP